MMWSEMLQSRLEIRLGINLFGGDHICHENLGDGGACTAYSLSREAPNQPSANFGDGPKPSEVMLVFDQEE